MSRDTYFGTTINMRQSLHTLISNSRLVIAAALMVMPSSLYAAVNATGDVPQASGFFGEIEGSIPTGGNDVDPFAADPNDTDTWDDDEVWEEYETQQNLLIGQTSAGEIEINGSSYLNYQHLVLGGVSTDFGGQLEIDLPGPNSENFDFQADLRENEIPITGLGILTVSGFGSTFNNAPTVVPGEFVSALAQSPSPSTATQPTPDNSARPLDGGTESGGGYDVHVGLIGSGILTAEGGGAVQIQDALFVGLGGTSNGVVSVDGIGSSISAYGRNEVDTMGTSTGTLEFGSIIGGHGTGSMSITNGGRVDMFNGVSLGAANSATALDGDGVGSGTVTITDVGSILNVYASRAIEDPTVIGLTAASKVALAVGELRDRGSAFPVAPLGSGTLEVGAGAIVNVTQTETYSSTNPADAKMVVGYNGKVIMQGGSVFVNDSLVNDGNIQGYGQMVSSFLGVTSTGSIDAGGLAGTETLDLQVAGDFNNDGSIRGNANITSGTFYNGSLGSIVVSAGDRLSIRSTTLRLAGIYSEFDNTLSGGFGLQTDEDGDGEVDGTFAEFYQANLGSIRVEEGGELEFGNADPVSQLDPVVKGVAFHNGRYATPDNSNPYVAGDPITGQGSQVDETIIGTITGSGGTLNFKSGLYNTGVIAFTGGSNTVVGQVLNGSMDYDDSTDVGIDNPNTLTNPDVFNNQLILPGVILVSGDGTTVTFTDNVENEGIIALGPSQTVANFLGDLTLSGGEVQAYTDFFTESAAIVVAGNVLVNNAALTIQFSTSAASSSSSSSAFSTITSSPEAGMSATILTAAGELSEESMFTDFDLPELDENLYWDVIYDTVQDEIRLEIVESFGFGADFTGDGVVDGDDLNVWISNVGITSGASLIQGDADLDGDVDLDDYLLLNEQIFTGIPALAGGGASASVSVPEPTSALLALLACSALGRARRQR